MSENRSEFNEEGYNKNGEYKPDGLLVNESDAERLIVSEDHANSFDEIVAKIFTQSVKNSPTFSRLSSQCSQQSIESDNNGEVEETTKQSTMTGVVEVMEEHRTQAFKEIVNSIIVSLGKKYTDLDLLSKIKIILTRPKLLGSAITSGFSAVTCFQNFWNNSYNLYTNIIGAVSAIATAYIVSNPIEASNILSLLDPSFLTKYYLKISEIENTEILTKQAEIMTQLNSDLLVELEKAKEINKKADDTKAAIDKLYQDIDKSIILREITSAIGEADQLKDSLDVVNFYNNLSVLFSSTDDESIQIVDIIVRLSSKKDIVLLKQVIEAVVEYTEQQLQFNDNLKTLLNELQKIDPEPGDKRKGLDTGSSAGGESNKKIGGKRKTHKKSSKSKKSKKHHKKHHKKHNKKTAHKKRGSRRK